MIRLCRTVGGTNKFTSISVDTTGVYVYTVELPDDDACTAVSSNMGKPCWYMIGRTDNTLTIYDCDKPSEVCGTVRFRYGVHTIVYAAIAADTPLAFVSHSAGDNEIVTSHGYMRIWDYKKRIRSDDPIAVVERNGQRLYIDENVVNHGVVRPVGEQVPFGWWLPHITGCGARMFAAFGDTLACTNGSLSYIPIWDVRVPGEALRIDKPNYDIRRSSYARCVFTTEHLLTTCIDCYRVELGAKLETVVWDLRNIDCYDLGSEKYEETLFETYAF